MNVFLIFVIIFFTSASKGDSSCPWDLPDLKLWSDFSTWDGAPPSERQDVIVTEKILLDVETPPLGTISIIDGGMIIFSPKHQVIYWYFSSWRENFETFQLA